MSLIRLNNRIVQKKMAALLMRPIDLSRKLGVSKQTGHFIVHHGGYKYAARLAEIFDCRVAELLIANLKQPKKRRHLLVNKKLRRTKGE